MGRRSFLQLGLVGAGAAAGLRQLAASPAAAQTGRPAGDHCAPDLPKNLVAPSLDAPVTPAVPETWNEPWVWRPSDWPGQQLDLNVVENENPGIAVGFGNPGSVLFSYGGQTPGPTIRMKGDEILHVKLRNLLGKDFGTTPVGPYPDVKTLPPGLTPHEVQEKAQDRRQIREDFCLGEHTNGVHSNRVTNLHTHGLHARPSRNPNGTHSDNVILRVLSQADFRRREQEGAEPSCDFLRKPDEIYFLRDDEQAGQADYEFRLGDVQRERREAINREREGKAPIPPQKHPAGTFWYHPHAHGATHNQVASGMAGFLIVEGDVDEAVNVHLAGEASPDPATPTAHDDPREQGYEQPPTQYKDHFVSYPLSRREGAEIFDRNRRFQIVTKGVDHPFHIHQNPFWVTRIEIPDENGDLVNVLDEPRWMDVIWIPRNRGRVVMRSRFPDYVGAYVHHCHILLHEDNGMMTVVEATPFADQANYHPRPKVSSSGMSEQELSMLYPRPTPEEGWVRSCSFVDPDPKTGQVYPGFQVTAPKLPGGA